MSTQTQISDTTVREITEWLYMEAGLLDAVSTGNGWTSSPRT